MIRHYLKLIWNRRRSNLLIAVEILLSFLVTVVVVTLAVHGADNFRRPLGFEWRDAWNLQVDARLGNLGEYGEEMPPEALETARQLFAAIREFPEVAAVGGTTCPPYGFSEWNSSSDINGWRLEYGVNLATDGLADALGLQLTRGRWFDARDDGASWVPVVVNERLAAEVAKGADPIGRSIPQERNAMGRRRPNSGSWASSPTSARTASLPPPRTTCSGGSGWTTPSAGRQGTSSFACSPGRPPPSRRSW